MFRYSFAENRKPPHATEVFYYYVDQLHIAVQLLPKQKWKMETAGLTIAYTFIPVALVPPSAFYRKAVDNHVLRFCFAKEDETLLRAAEILHKA